MAAPLSPDRLLAILKAEGVKVAEYPGWRTRSRDAATGKTFGPVRMVLNHHTAGSNSLTSVAETGRPDLPAPLAHIHLAKTGLATMCSAGRANHAGTMAFNSFTSFADEATTHPDPAKSTGLVDGNDCSYGIETENLGTGSDVYPRAQYDAWIRINAALCREYGWSGQSCAGHLETSVEGKVDPRGPVDGYGSRGRFTLTMTQFRQDVDERLAHAPGWNPDEEDDVALTAQDIEKIAAKVLEIDGIIPNPVTSSPNKFISLATSARNVETVVRRIEAAEAAQTAAITTLAKLVGSGVDTDAVVAAVQDAIAKAVVHVDVDVTGPAAG